MSARRLLVIDEDLPHRLGIELVRRGLLARRVAYFGLKGTKDPTLLAVLGTRLLGLEWVLVTGDDKMPLEHGATVAALSPTIATVDPRIEDGYTLDQWRSQVVHDSALRIRDRHALGTIRRYSLRASREWTPLR